MVTLAVVGGISALVLHLVSGARDEIDHHDCPSVYVCPKPDLVVRSVALGTGIYGTGKVVGVILNDSNVAYAYARVQVELLGRKGDLIGTMSTTVYDLSPHSLHQFRALITKASVSSVKVRQVMGIPVTPAPSYP